MVKFWQAWQGRHLKDNVFYYVMNECLLLYWILTGRIPGSKLRESPCTDTGRTKVGQNRKVWDRMKQISFSKPASAVHGDFEQTHVYLRLGLCLKITHYSLYCRVNRSNCYFAVVSECVVRIIKYSCFIVKKVITAGHWAGNIQYTIMCALQQRMKCWEKYDGV